jgi:hypothetical protein
MSTNKERLTFTGAGSQKAGRGRFFLLANATLPVTLRFRQPNHGAGIVLENVGVCKVGPVSEESYWESVEVVSPGAQVVDYIVGDDPVEFPNAVTVTGTTLTAEAPSSAVVTPDDNPIPAATTEVIAANLTRKRITVGNLSTNTVALRVRAVGATGGGAELQPGMSYEFRTTAALEVRNNDGAVAGSYWIFEET